MLLSAVSFLVVAQSSSEFSEGLMNNPVLYEVSNTRYLAHKPEFVTLPAARPLLLGVILPSAESTNKAAGRLFV